MTPADVFDAVTELAAKSLVSVDVSGDPTYFRLLETTRCYVSNRLAESEELPAVQRRHAEHLLELLCESERAWRDAENSAWRHRYGRHVDDVRASLGWAMSPGGDVELGIAITVRSVLLLFQLSLADECMRFANAAMEALVRLGPVDPKLEFELNIVRGFLLTHTRGDRPQTQRSLERALEIAERRGDPRELALAYSANWVGAFMRSEPRAMFAFAQKFETFTAEETDPATMILHDRMKAHALHALGDQRAARVHAERILAAPGVARPPFLTGIWLDRHVTVGILLARVLWLQGLPDQAEKVLARTAEHAGRDGESVSLAHVLALAAFPLAMWTGRLDLARERFSLLLRHTREHLLVAWRGFVTSFGSLLDWHEGGCRGQPVLPDGFKIQEHRMQLGELLATLHPAWADEVTFQRGDSGDAGWCQAELLRVRGERARAEGREADAEALFLRSLERARGDGALSWEVRTATSLARLLQEQGRQQEAVELLRSVLTQLTEGDSTADVKEAVALHNTLRGATAPAHRPAPLLTASSIHATTESRPQASSRRRPVARSSRS